MQLQKAERKQALIKLALQGPSGSGKTYSSLLLAYGLVGNWNQIVVIDTENNSSHLYSHLGSFNVLSLTEPFSPERYIEAIEACEKAGIKVIMIDSISPE
jgi:CO dehydrogenase nickel-insertion accessory protein CooC1